MNVALKKQNIQAHYKDKVKKDVSPSNVDKYIKLQIAKLTSKNSAVWTSPEYDRREYVHRIFQYPAMMVPIVQKHIIDIIKQAKPSIQNVIDPFMGSATSLVACMENGLNCYGQDINPLAVLIGETRTGPFLIPEIKKNRSDLYNDIITDTDLLVEADFKGMKKWFKDKVAIELSRIVRGIRKEKELQIRRFYWVILAEVVRITSNDRTSTFKLHARPLTEIDNRRLSPIEEFKRHLDKTLQDLELYYNLLNDSNQIENYKYKALKHISLHDSSKKIITENSKKSFFDLLVTSPPYGDNRTTVTYGQHSFLPLQWIDLADINPLVNKDYLKSTMEIDTRSLGGQNNLLSEEQIKKLSNVSSTFKITYQLLQLTTIDRAKKVLNFINDLYKVIDQIFEVMGEDSYQVWTIGNRTVGGIEIPNNQILKEIISYKGGVLVAEVKREIVNKRMAKRNNGSQLMNFENILIFRKVG